MAMYEYNDEGRNSILRAHGVHYTPSRYSANSFTRTTDGCRCFDEFEREEVLRKLQLKASFWMVKILLSIGQT